MLDVRSFGADDEAMTHTWRELAVFADRASAEVLAGLLRSEGVDVRVVLDEPVPGLVKSCTVLVLATQWAHAQRICSQAPLTEEEWARYIGQSGKGHKQQ
nr:hypothetical protein [Gammaproteobacteria bacterium]